MIREAFVISRMRGKPVLICLICEDMSFHPEDVLQAYCWRCNLFLADLPEGYRRPPRTVRNMPGWMPPLANDPNHTPPDAG